MRLGATLHRYCGIRINDPDAYIAECRRFDFRSATCPDHHVGDSDDVHRIRAAFEAAQITIAEIGGWSNCLDQRSDERRNAMTTTTDALAVADELGAVCCINLAGTLCAETLYGPHPDNFSDDAFDGVVQWVQQVLREVQPTRTRLAIEAMPWTPIHDITSYQRLLDAVDDERLAVHFDPANLVTDAHTYYRTDEMIHRCFDQFGPRIVACHAKDILQRDPKTVELVEVPPGQGVLDYRTLLARAERLSTDLPIVIEHLDSEQQFADAAAYIHGIAAELAGG